MKKVFILLLTISILKIDAVTAQNKPTGLHFWRHSPSFEKVDLFWTDKSNDETGFQIQEKVDGGSWVTIGNVGANVKKFTTQTNGNWTYVWRVRAKKGNANSAWSNVTPRAVGKLSQLEVYPVVPGIANPGNFTVNGKTFPKIAHQTPKQTGKGKVTKVSTFYKVTVKKASGGGTFISTPTYETRPQVRDDRNQNDPYHSGPGHSTYSYGKYGPNANANGYTMHTRHWTNFDASVKTVVRIELLNAAPAQTIKLNQTKIYPAPIKTTQINSKTIEIELPAPASGNTKHMKPFMIAFNRSDWQTARGAYSYEHPLMIFVNPIVPTPGSAPNNKIKNFNGGKLKIIGGGIHKPANSWRFYGQGENNTATEVWVPGHAYMHGGFYFNNTNKTIKLHGRGIYSDEFFMIYENNDRNWKQRTAYAGMVPVEGNSWGKKGFWDSKLGVENSNGKTITVDGLTSIGGRMGVVTHANGDLDLKNHKDVGYGGGVYQAGVNASASKTKYTGCFIVNDDDITYCHQEYTMDRCATRNFVNGPSFQFGWQVNDNISKAKITNHTVLPGDRPANGSHGKNHGVFNGRLQAGELKKHLGGEFSNMTAWGQENIFMNIGIWEDRGPANPSNNSVHIFSDKTFKNITVKTASLHKNKLRTHIDPGTNQKSYIRFLHFDNFKIGNNVINHIDDGNHFEYNNKLNESNNMNGVLLHTITFFSLPGKAAKPNGQGAPIGKIIRFKSEEANKNVKADGGLPSSLSPLVANGGTGNNSKFEVVNAGNGFIALKANNGYFVKADPNRYGYLYTKPDGLRGDNDTKNITNDAKFVWVKLSGTNKFALWSNSLGRYVRAEKNSGPNRPLYAANSGTNALTQFSYTVLSNARIVEEENEEENLAEELSILENEPYLLYPNPVKDILRIQGIEKNLELQITDLSGKEVLSVQGRSQIDVSALKAGVYFLNIEHKAPTRFIKE